jgi:hypothetical protein
MRGATVARRPRPPRPNTRGASWPSRCSISPTRSAWNASRWAAFHGLGGHAARGAAGARTRRGHVALRFAHRLGDAPRRAGALSRAAHLRRPFGAARRARTGRSRWPVPRGQTARVAPGHGGGAATGALDGSRAGDRRRGGERSARAGRPQGPDHTDVAAPLAERQRSSAVHGRGAWRRRCRMRISSCWKASTTRWAFAGRSERCWRLVRGCRRRLFDWGVDGGQAGHCQSPLRLGLSLAPRALALAPRLRSQRVAEPLPSHRAPAPTSPMGVGVCCEITHDEREQRNGPCRR